MLPQSKHPTSDELMCWGCVLGREAKDCWADSKHCYVPSLSFIGHEAGRKAGDCADNVKPKFCGKQVGDKDLVSLLISLNLSSSEFSLA